jgi:hypothetical protein
LFTAKGREVENLIEIDPPPTQAIQRDQLLANTVGKRWTRRKPACGRYNCAGHVWASRRTSILDPKFYYWFIQDDGYRVLSAKEPAKPGDIAVYIDAESKGEILHVGRICTVVEGPTPDSPPIPMVLSKWNSTAGEYIHHISDHPYSPQFKVIIQVMTDRPN